MPDRKERRKGVCVISILNERMTKDVHLEILKLELTAAKKNFGFIDSIIPNKFDYKYYQYNDLDHKFNPIENF